MSCQFPTQSERQNELFLPGPESREKTKWRAGDGGRKGAIRGKEAGCRERESERARMREMESTAEEVSEV